MNKTDFRLEEMCKHGFQTPFHCPICEGRVEPREVSAMVYETAFGTVYHYWRECPSLVYGQTLVLRLGGMPSPIESLPESIAKFDRPPCYRCSPSHINKKRSK